MERIEVRGVRTKDRGDVIGAAVPHLKPHHFGWRTLSLVTIVGPGDLDGDGHPDLVFGAELNDRGGTDAGAAFFLYSPPPAGTTILSAADAVFAGEHPGDATGYRVAAPGDLDADGFDDQLVAAPTYSDVWSQQGAAFLFRGGTP